MDIQTFIQNFKEAFGENAELPLVFWYSDEQKGETEKINGCFFKGMKTVRDGGIISLNAENIGCGGGKFYTGFTEMPERVPTFVSLKEKYKQTPEMVIDFIQQIGVPRTENKYLHFARIDKVESLEEIEGVVFLANPDMLSGLTTWAFYDNNAADCVVSTFGSGCSAVVTQATIENRKGGKRTFLGFFDPSVRPHFEADKLSYTIPMSRFKEMYETMRQSCLFDTHAWGKCISLYNYRDIRYAYSEHTRLLFRCYRKKLPLDTDNSLSRQIFSEYQSLPVLFCFPVWNL